MGHSVLIVDDHAPFRQVVRALLVDAGFEVVGEATGGADAVEQSRRLRPGVVLLDIQLPDIDGFEVARRLDADGFAGATILVSGRDPRAYRGRLVGSPARGFLAKSDLSAASLTALLG